MLLIVLGWISVGPAQEGSGPATLLDEQTKRRRQEELNLLGRAQKSNHFQFEQKLSRFDYRSKAVQRRTGDGAVRRHERHRLNQRLGQIQQKEKRRQSHIKQSLDNLELNKRNGDFRQRQELNRLRDRQRSQAFVDRHKIRLRRYGASRRGRK